jgi:hypothetical protein
VSIATAAASVLGLAFLSAGPKALHADDGSRGAQQKSDGARADVSAFSTEVERTLKNQQDRTVDLAKQLIGGPDAPDDLERQLAIQPIKIEAARARLQSAVLDREVAELALVEYEQGIFVQQKADAEAELSIAHKELEWARPRIQLAKDRSAQIAQKSKGTTSDVANELRHSAAVAIAELEAQSAGFAIEVGESKLRVLLQYEKPKRLKELRAEVVKARSDELAARLGVEREQGKLKGLQASIKEQRRNAREGRVRPLLDRRVLVSLDRAVSLDEQIRAKLEQLNKNGQANPRLREEIKDLTNQLQILVDQAEVARSTEMFDRLKARIHAAAVR